MLGGCFSFAVSGQKESWVLLSQKFSLLKVEKGIYVLMPCLKTFAQLASIPSSCSFLLAGICLDVHFQEGWLESFSPVLIVLTNGVVAKPSCVGWNSWVQDFQFGFILAVKTSPFFFATALVVKNIVWL